MIDWEGRDLSTPNRLIEEGRFYWKELLDAGQPPHGRGFPMTAAVWNGLTLPEYGKLDSFGYATYEFHMRGFAPTHKGYQIGLWTASSAFRIIAYRPGP